MKILTAFFALLFAAGVPAFAASDFTRQFSYLKDRAMSGDAKALYMLGQIYERGDGVPADKNVARCYYLAAANLGDEAAKVKLGVKKDSSGSANVPARAAPIPSRAGTPLAEETEEHEDVKALSELRAAYENEMLALEKSLARDVEKYRRQTFDAIDRRLASLTRARRIKDAETLLGLKEFFPGMLSVADLSPYPNDVRTVIQSAQKQYSALEKQIREKRGGVVEKYARRAAQLMTQASKAGDFKAAVAIRKFEEELKEAKNELDESGPERIFLDSTRQGLICDVFFASKDQRAFWATADIGKLAGEMKETTPKETMRVSSISIPDKLVGEDLFGLRFSGEFFVPKSATYTFYAQVDDALLMSVAGKEVFNISAHTNRKFRESPKISLKKGWHPIEIFFKEWSGIEALHVQYEIDGDGRREFPPKQLRCRKKAEKSAKAAVPVSLTEKEFAADCGNGVKMEFVRIPAGTFMMGSPESEEGRWQDAEKQVRVNITKPFFLGKTEVTQTQYQAVVGSHSSYFKGERRPVENVSWDDAMAFCAKLTSRARAAGTLPAGWKFTLPTEAQWEYACRAGTTTRFCSGDAERELCRYGNFVDKSYQKSRGDYARLGDLPWDDGHVETAPVGSFRPNAWGLYDMHGNVWEWCLDYYDEEMPGGDDPCRTMPGGGERGYSRVHRGGCWHDTASSCRSAMRFSNSAGCRTVYLGFRVAAVQE